MYVLWARPGHSDLRLKAVQDKARGQEVVQVVKEKSCCTHRRTAGILLALLRFTEPFDCQRKSQSA